MVIEADEICARKHANAKWLLSSTFGEIYNAWLLRALVDEFFLFLKTSPGVVVADEDEAFRRGLRTYASG